jgi:hypothetical protein
VEVVVVVLLLLWHDGIHPVREQEGKEKKRDGTRAGESYSLQT